MLNAGPEDAVVELDWETLEFNDELSGRSPQFKTVNYTVKDLWDASAKPFTTRAKGKKKGQTLPARTSVTVASHDVVTYRLTPAK